MSLVAWPLNESEARVDLVLIGTSLLSLIYATGKPKDSGQQNDKKMSCKNGNAQSCATFFGHSTILSLPAVLLRKVSNDAVVMLI